ncbi:hypothetical protein CUZ56_00835 [Saezia sanguinis]|uniref:C-type lysozyme inhibitor domain-containing protein n=1 Tax=Saezia sanguinis TaxID=1965230 RepID=A0A433SHW4_9BURK|nr:hypothetical protein [Saezia sanguinis]RUS68345.1 hypothetical protein CUZ56_00835 [Saezia sanguinis]
MPKSIRTLTLACLGAIALSGCQFLADIIPAAPRTDGPAPATGTAPETITFYSADNPPWARLHVGKMACAEGVSFNISRADANNELDLNWKGRQYTLRRVQTSSGAFRYEDPASGMVLIQIPAKSLLLDAKIGQRLADECNPG